jgi:hypothetical protein
VNDGPSFTLDMPRSRHVDNWRLWLRDLRRTEDRVNAERPQAIRAARAAGASWGDIALELGMSKAGVFKRYRHLDDELEREEPGDV